MPATYLDGLHTALTTLAWCAGLLTPAAALLLVAAIFTPLVRATRIRWLSHRLTRAARRSGRTQA